MSALGDNHRRAILAAIRYVDRMLRDAARAADAAGSPLDEQIVDVTPSQRLMIVDEMATLRARLVEVVRRLGLDVPEPSVRVSRTIDAALTYAEITLEDLRPSKLRGYGALPVEAAELVERETTDLLSAVQRAHEHIAACIAESTKGESQ